MNLAAGVTLAGVDSFWVVVAIAIGSAIYNWLQKRNEAAKDQDSQPSPDPRQRKQPLTGKQPVAPRQTKPASWEEELRRLLEGEPPAEPAPPIIIYEQRPAAPAPPPLRNAPPVVEEQSPAPVRPLATLKESSSAYERAEQIDKQVEAQLGRIGSMAEATTALQKAGGLDVAVADRLSKVTGHLVPEAAVVHRKVCPPEVEQVVALFRNPRSARQAVLASFILGPPKAFDETGSL